MSPTEEVEGEPAEEKAIDLQLETWHFVAEVAAKLLRDLVPLETSSLFRSKRVSVAHFPCWYLVIRLD